MTEFSGRILGIDYGSKRTGIAISDPMGIIAQPQEVIQYSDSEELVARVGTLVSEKDIRKIVVGIPKTLSNGESEMTKTVSAFVKDLQSSYPDIEIITWDERLTSMQADRVLIEAGVRREKRKTRIDSLAASIMLQSYLDFLQQTKSEKHEIKE